MWTRLSSLFRQKPAAAPVVGASAPEIAGFESLESIGSGGFSRVYKAKQTGFDRFVAVKVLNVGLESTAQRTSFERECRALGLMSQHPNIVTVFNAAFTGEGRPAIVMEYFGRGTLGEQVKSHGPLSIEAGMSLAIQMAGALETAHGNGVIHRDIKPNNLFVSDFGQPALGDFGISSFADDRTITGVGGGLTVHYAPPELIEGDSATAASDVYSLAATVFTLLAGRRPFPRPSHQSVGELARRILIEPAPRLPVDDAPPGLIAALLRAMEKDPRDRYSTAAEFGEALQSVQQATGIAVTAMPLTVASGQATGMVSSAPAPAAPLGTGAPIAAADSESDVVTRTIARPQVASDAKIDLAPAPDESATPISAVSTRKLRGVALAALALVAIAVAAVAVGGRSDDGTRAAQTTTTQLDDDAFFGAPEKPTNVVFSPTADPLVYEVTWNGITDGATYQVERLAGDDGTAAEVIETASVPALLTITSAADQPCLVVRAIGSNNRISPDSDPSCLRLP